MRWKDWWKAQRIGEMIVCSRCDRERPKTMVRPVMARPDGLDALMVEVVKVPVCLDCIGTVARGQDRRWRMSEVGRPVRSVGPRLVVAQAGAL